LGFSRRLSPRVCGTELLQPREADAGLEQCPLQPEQGPKQGHDLSLSGGIEQPVLRLLDQALDARPPGAVQNLAEAGLGAKV